MKNHTIRKNKTFLISYKGAAKYNFQVIVKDNSSLASKTKYQQSGGVINKMCQFKEL